MKINDKNTALHFLLDNDPLECGANEFDHGSSEAFYFLRHEFPQKRSFFKERIQYISNPFMAAYNKGAKKLDNLFIEEPIMQSGTLILPHEKSGNFTVFYQLSAICDKGLWNTDCTIISI